MLKRYKLWHLILFFTAVIILGNISFLINISKLFFHFIILLTENFETASAQINLSLIDHFISLLLIILIPVITIIKRKSDFLQKNLSFSIFIVSFLMIIFLFAPLLTQFHPDFQKDLRVTKLLPPLSKVYFLMKDYQEENTIPDFFSLKKKIIKESFNENIIIADSVSSSSNKIYYQKQKEYKAENIVSVESKIYLLGTDEFGRDVFTRLVYGTRISLFVGLGAVTLTLLLGVSLGFLAGYNGGFIDSVLSRITEMFLSFPIIFLIILILALFGNSLLTVIIVLGFSGWMSLFKIVRSEVISIKQKEYFISAKLSGLNLSSLLMKEIFPVILAPVVVNLVFQYGNVILAESALNYLGLGTGNVYPSWGGMIEAGQQYLTDAWWMIFFPGAALFITLYTANSLGRELNLHFNPRLQND